MKITLLTGHYGSETPAPQHSALDTLTHDLGFSFQVDESGEEKDVYRRGEGFLTMRGAQFRNDDCLTIERKSFSDDGFVVSLYIDGKYDFYLRLRCSFEKARDLALKFTVDWIRSTH